MSCDKSPTTTVFLDSLVQYWHSGFLPPQIHSGVKRRRLTPLPWELSGVSSHDGDAKIPTYQDPPTLRGDCHDAANMEFAVDAIAGRLPPLGTPAHPKYKIESRVGLA